MKAAKLDAPVFTPPVMLGVIPKKVESKQPLEMSKGNVLELPRQNTHPSIVTGMFPKSVTASLLGATSLLGIVAPQVAQAQETIAAVDTSGSIDPQVVRMASELEASASTMTPSELATARRELYRSYVGSTTLTPAPTRGEKVWGELLDELEARMHVTAYDMAHPGTWTPIDGHPGYKTIAEGEVKDLMLSALRRVPIGELPGGQALVGAVRSIPGAGPLDVANMSFEELKDALGAQGRAALELRFKGFFDAHKIETAVVGFGAVTALRMSSPTAADYIDKLVPRIEVWDGHVGPIAGDASIKYRERRILPDVDLSLRTGHRVGNVDLRAVATGTISTSDHPVTGTLEVGARTGSSTAFVDLSGTVNTEKKAEVWLRGRLNDSDERLHVAGDLGIHTAPDFKDPRADLTVSLEKDVRLDGGARGSFGVFVGAGVDLNGKNEDVRAGVVFSLRW